MKPTAPRRPPSASPRGGAPARGSASVRGNAPPQKAGPSRGSPFVSEVPPPPPPSGGAARAQEHRAVLSQSAGGSLLMKTSLDHLPKNKKDQLRRITAIIRAVSTVELVILFGSYARGDWVEDRGSGYCSDLDILVVAAPQVAVDTVLWAGVKEQAQKIAGRVRIALITHDLKFVNREIRQGNYFFCDIVLEGIVLHGAGSALLAKPRALNDEERLRFGVHHFRYWYESASDFWLTSTYCSSLGKLSTAAYLLHQAAERYLHAILLVFGGYKPKTHDVEELADEAATYHPRLASLLPRADPEDKERFCHLKRAYVEARYSKSYSISLTQLTVLRDQVRDLAVLAREVCWDKLASILGPDAVGLLPKPPLANDSPVELRMPELYDPLVAEAWRQAVVEASRSAGLREGEQRGRARSLVELLRLRGLPLSVVDEQRILACLDSDQLEVWWSKALQVATVPALFTS